MSPTLTGYTLNCSVYVGRDGTDARSAATLGVLAELARKTQVILFTHHAHLCDLAAGLDAARNGGAGVFVRSLE